MTKAAKLIEIAVPDEVPPGWRRTTLGEIGEYINGRGFKKPEWSDKGLPIIRIQNLTGTGKEQNYYDGEIDVRHVVNPGDLLISWAATLGAYLWAGPRAALNQHIFKVRSFVDKKFHYYLMQHILGDLYRQTHGSGMVHITKSKFDSMPIVVPETENQQKHIVAEIEKQFSRLDEAVADLKRVKANLKRYKAAVLKAAVEGHLVETEASIARREGRSYETGEQLLQRILETRRSRALKAGTQTGRKGKGKYKEPAAPATTDLPELPEGWVWASLDQLSWGSSYGTSAKCAYDNKGPPVLRIPNVDKGAIDLADLKYGSPDLAVTRGDALTPGDMLIIRTNGSRSLIGRAAIVTTHFPRSTTYASYLIRFRLFTDSGLSDWVLTFWQSPSSRLWIESKAATSAGQHNISMSVLATSPLPLPPVAEQIRIVAEVDHRLSLIRETEAQVDISIKRAERLHQSVLYAVFSSGLIVPR